MRMIGRMICMMMMCLVMAGCYPPPAKYATTKLVSARRATLSENLLKLLPAEQRNLPAARAEARWLADTAYKAAAGISRVNNSNFPGWAGNALINARVQDRGLCWHYQHDLFRELRRRELHFFRLGCCVRDLAERSEHNCVYIAARGDEWPKAWVLDAWMWNGRLKVSYGPGLNQKRWKDLKRVENMLTAFYKEGHRVPVEHWLLVRSINGKYDYYSLDHVISSPQYRRMRANMQKGYREHPGSPVNY